MIRRLTNEVTSASLQKLFRNTFVFCLLAISSQAWAQDGEVTGTVTDSSGDPLPGVTILVKGTTNGTVSSLDGTYKIFGVSESDVLIYSFIGAVTQEITVGSQSRISVSLADDIQSLEEVVVVGYGTQKKSVVTGSISKIDAEQLKNSTDLRIEQALQGRAAGVVVMNNSGQPGDQLSIRIRGTGTNGNADPLFIVDGLPLTKQGLDFLNPTDVASMEILKDATATAIYGTRGANGVVIITTKGGKKGDAASISYDGYYGVQNPWRKQDVLNSSQYFQVINEAYINEGQSPFFSVSDINDVTWSTNWQDEMYNYNAPKSSHTVSMTGGSETGSFASSLNYFAQEGIVGAGNSNFQRVTFRINGSKTYKRFTLNSNANFVNIQSRGIDANSQYGTGINQAINMPPIVPVQWEDGAWGVPGDFGLAMQEVVNPVALFSIRNSETKTYKGLGGITAGYEIIDGLTIRSSFSTEVAIVDFRSYTPVYRINATNKSDVNSTTKSINEYFRWNWDNTINYEKTIGEHKITLLAGITRFREWNENLSGTKDSLIFDSFDKAYINNSIQVQGRTGGGFGEHTLQSYFGRAYYDYAEKYLFEGVVRMDGSSRFGDNNIYGIFPAVALGWVFSKESFFPSSNVIDFGKIRTSWGQNGSENIADFQYTSLISGGHTYFFGTSQDMYPGVQPAFYSNPSLKWEASEQLDVGLDLTFFSGKLGFTTDYYVKKNKDWLVSGNANFPRVIGNNVSFINAGEVRNSGFEFELTYKDTFFENLDVDFGLTASTNENEITSITEGVDVLHGAGGVHGQGEIQRGTVGQPMGYFWGYQTAGIFNHQAELGNAPHQPNAQLGDLIFVDTNEDGTLNDEDKVNIGNPFPKLTLGFNTSINWKGLDFNMFWYSAMGHQIWNATRRSDLIVSNYTTAVLDRWTENNTNTDIPRVTSTDPNRSWRNPSDFYVEDADYVRLKRVTLGYTLPDQFTSNIGVQKVRFYVTSENLLTFTKYSGLEVEIGGGPLYMGIDYGVYPQAQTFMGGINVTF